METPLEHLSIWSILHRYKEEVRMGKTGQGVGRDALVENRE